MNNKEKLTQQRRRGEDSVDPEIVGEFKDVFDMLDGQKKGYLDKEDVKEAIESKINGLKEAITNLDKETVLEVAKKQGKKIREMAEELVEYVVDKGTPVLEKTASAVRCKAIDVTKEVLAKLESKQAK